MPEKEFICPRCQQTWKGFPAIGRVDNVTEICSPCGMQEGFDAFYGKELTPYNL
jgi:hypothetical protein